MVDPADYSELALAKLRLKRSVQNRTDIDCKRCGVIDSGYMVHDVLWVAAGLKRDDIVCADCFEKALGRPLQPDDLTVSILNERFFRGFRMGAVYMRQHVERIAACLSDGEMRRELAEVIDDARARIPTS
jgi:hypothetical protein